MVFRHACSGVMPWRMNSTIRNAPQTLMFASPRPVDPAAPTLLSQYCPAPMIGESPTLPGSFQERPLVVVTDEISPRALTAFMLMVPVVNLTRSGSSAEMLAVGGDAEAAPGVSSQLSFGFKQAFQRSQSWRLFSVRRFCSLKPICSANFLAPGPASRM